MGIKDFSKVFTFTNKIKIKDLNSKKIAIDAMTEIYRASLCGASVKLLTDDMGNPTLFIKVIFANIIEMQKNNIDMIWVFDHEADSKTSEEFHNPAKVNEMIKRQKRKESAQAKLDVKNLLTDDLFTDEEFNNIMKISSIADLASASASSASASSAVIQVSTASSAASAAAAQPTATELKKVKTKIEEVHALEKQTFKVTRQMINEIKLILNCLNIKYIESPKGFEGEQIASLLSECNIVDGVLSSDTDPIAFGAKTLYRRTTEKKVFAVYERDDILSQISKQIGSKASMKDLRKICVILGTDFNTKTKGIGPKTIYKKYQTTDLTSEQKTAVNIFRVKPTLDLNVFNLDKKQFKNTDSFTLLKFMVEIKSFNESLVRKSLSTVVDLGDITIDKNKL